MMGRRRKGRRVDGILLLDKPLGLSSNAALQHARRLFNAQKAGHTGSLDPLATGLLPICFGEATKASGYLLDTDKCYQVSVQLGRQTSTGDAEGEVILERAVPDMAQSAIERVLAGFLGESEQVPPMYSALKHEGKRLYALARAGQIVEREPRTIHVDALRLIRQAGDQLDLEVHCSKGTYVRTLVEDIARALGTCGHVSKLHRTAVGPFAGSEMHDFDHLEALADAGDAALDGVLLPIEVAFAGWPSVQLNEDSAWYLQRGQPVQVAKAPTEGWLCIYGPDRRLLGLGEILDDGRVAPRRLLVPPAPA